MASESRYIDIAQDKINIQNYKSKTCYKNILKDRRSSNYKYSSNSDNCNFVCNCSSDVESEGFKDTISCANGILIRDRENYTNIEEFHNINNYNKNLRELCHTQLV